MPMLPRPTVRLRLTLLYGILFLVSGALLLAITYTLVAHNTGRVLVELTPDGSFRSTTVPFGLSDFMKLNKESNPYPRVLLRNAGAAPDLMRDQVQIQALLSQQYASQMRELLIQSGIALAVMAAVSVGLGWLVTGRALRPVRTIVAEVREMSATNLHDRLTLDGPDDELSELGQTFNDLIDRLERSFNAQRQFVANASHELRTPLARQRTLIEVALNDPDATVDSLRANYVRVLAANEQQERLIEALLTLARSERGLDHKGPIDLSNVVSGLLSSLRPEARRRRLRVTADLGHAQVMGDARLIERLATNLLENALHHNADNGSVRAVTETRDGRAILTVSNTGPVIDPADVDRLFLPFQRRGADRTDHAGGLGLGLSIVRAIVSAHGAALDARARPEGGLEIEVSFPAAPAV
jgi:signal transduction histidine kinase